MNNGQPHQVLQGRGTNNGIAGSPQQHQVQQQQQQNPLAVLMAHANRFAGTMNNPGSSMTSMYSYGASKTNYAGILGLEDNINEEQHRQQAILEGGHVSNMVVSSCMSKKDTPLYRTLRGALERFKSPVRNGPQEPEFVNFVNQIDSNNALFNFIVLHAGMQLAAEIATGLMKIDESFGNQGAHPMRQLPAIQEAWYKCLIDTFNVQFLDYLTSDPKGCEVYYRMSEVGKRTLIERENAVHQIVQARYVAVNLECPFKKTNLSNIGEKYSVRNPLLDLPVNAEIFGVPDFNAGIYGQPTDYGNAAQNQANGAAELLRYTQELVAQNRKNMVDNPPTPAERPYFINDYDAPELLLSDITRETRSNYVIGKYLVNIPGTEWNLIRSKDVDRILSVLDLDDGIPYRPRDARSPGCVTVYRINWEKGTFNFKLIPYKSQVWDVMGKLISNPEELLPYMYEENGVQKTTFNLKDMEVNEFVREGWMEPMAEVKNLKTQPNVLIGNSPYEANLGNEKTVQRLNGLTQTYNPHNKLDAFILPAVVSREYVMEPTTNMDKFYSEFRTMVQGNKENLSDTMRVIQGLRYSYNDCESEEFKAFLKPYLTNLINRWMVEVRGYDEVRTPGSNALCQRITDVFEDIEDLVEWFKNNDVGALRDFLDYKTNFFLRGGIEILVPQEKVKERCEKELAKESNDEYTHNALLQIGMRTVHISRSTVFINLADEFGPVNDDAVVVKESGDPKLFAIVRKAMKVTSKHFEDTPQVFIKFNKDSSTRLWVATPSGIDPEHVYNLRLMENGQEYCNPYPARE